MIWPEGQQQRSLLVDFDIWKVLIICVISSADQLLEHAEKTGQTGFVEIFEG